jgi:hypothetical protein
MVSGNGSGQSDMHPGNLPRGAVIRFTTPPQPRHCYWSVLPGGTAFARVTSEIE